MMKGLLIKDFKLLMGQKQFFLTVCGLAVLFSFVNGDPAFAMPYVAIMLCMFTISTISYDEYDNGGAFLFSLPITRKVYVTEKYLYGFLLCVISFLFTSIVSCLMMAVKKEWIAGGEFVSILVVSALFAVLMLGVMIPAQLKFGAEKSRMALLGIVMLFYIIIYVVVFLAERTGIDVERIFAAFSGMEQVVIVVAMCGTSAVITLISYIISLRIMEKKEF